jgi:hypothetical protein
MSKHREAAGTRYRHTSGWVSGRTATKSAKRFIGHVERDVMVSIGARIAKSENPGFDSWPG